ncbi:MAG: Lrp/AsnC family transcriptional regulator [Candidatus Micrarchaeia archaeon]
MMLPEAVQKTKEELEKELNHRLHVVRIHGAYYAYEEKATVIEGKKKVAVLYLGKINEDGTFVKGKHRKKLYENVLSVEELVERPSNPIEELVHPDGIDLAILEMLSTDARTPVKKIAKRLGIGIAQARSRIESLEKRYGIKYTIEIAPRPFGYFRYIALVKFIDEMPKIEDMKKVLQAEPTIQFAALLKGDYDLLIYMFAENTHTLENKIYDIRSSPAFAPYKADWYVTYITYAYGFVPLRDEFFEELKGKVWHRTKETPRKPPNALTEREWLVLRALNKNSSGSFAEKDRELGLDRGATLYTYYKLLEKKIIWRTTITMTTLPIKYNVVMVCRQRDISSFNLKRKEALLHFISLPNTPTSTYSLIGDIGAPYGLLFIAPSYTEDIQEIEETLGMYLKGTEIRSNIIAQVLIGEFGYRRISENITPQYQIINELNQQEKYKGINTH